MERNIEALLKNLSGIQNYLTYQNLTYIYEFSFFRKTIFMQALEEIDAHNKKFEIGLSTYTQGINAYSDLTWDEFQERFLMKHEDTKYLNLCEKAQAPEPNPNTPRAVDWRSIMNPVKSQGCGDCWAFAAIGAIEGNLSKITKVGMQVAMGRVKYLKQKK